MSNQTRTQAGFMRLVTAINSLKSYTDTEIGDALAEITTASTADRARANHTGTQSADTVVDGTTNKAYTAAEKTKLAGVATGATNNSPNATLLARANHTGTQSADTITDGTTNKVLTAAEKTKLAGIATGATAYTNTDADARVVAVTGDKSTLTTTAKNTIVAAINELDAAIDQLAGEAGAIDDASTDTDTTWSSTKTATEIANAVAALAGTAPATLDTLGEISDALGDNPNAITEILTALGNRVRFDAAQTLTAPQKAQAIANIGAVSAADIGNTDYDYVADIEAALA